MAVKGDVPSIVTCQLDQNGSLRAVSRRDVDAALQYLALTPDGTALLAASYGGGFGISLPVDDSGIGEVVSRVDEPNMHSCAVSADGRTAYFVSLGADLIVQCSLDGSTLTPLDPPSVAAPVGSGPRHIVLTRDGRSAYVMTEYSGEVLHYRRAPDGVLTPGGRAAAFAPDRGLRHSRFGADPTAEHLIWGADLHLSSDESVCWASERSESTLAVVTIDADGTPHAATEFVPTEQQPRGFAVSPDGRFLLCTGEMSSEISLFATDAEGGLTLMGRTGTGNGANWVRFLEL